MYPCMVNFCLSVEVSNLHAFDLFSSSVWNLSVVPVMNPILGISDSGISLDLYLARSLAEFSISVSRAVSQSRLST